ncbi:hypothetical protein OIU84_024951 [Salix udensis]|uniref:Uncharacterized protein n=1 Tax=Salix udensis TaxID=889485 RepID=A0AAD6KIE0_9ROSI|nr:hypothetical protein OIU84_024951 [Salix udensis]
MASRDKKPTKPSSSRAGGIRTLSDLNRWSGPDSDNDDEDAPQEYYTVMARAILESLSIEKDGEGSWAFKNYTLGWRDGVETEEDEEEEAPVAILIPLSC